MHVSRQAHTPADPQLSDSASGMQSTPNAAVKTLDELLHRLVLAIAMPMAWAMAAALLGMIFLQEWQLKQDRERVALMARRSLDGQLSQRMRALDALAQSSAMAGPSIGPASYRAALDYRQTFNADVVVADPRGQMLINTRVPWDSPCPWCPHLKDGLLFRKLGRSVEPQWVTSSWVRWRKHRCWRWRRSVSMQACPSVPSSQRWRPGHLLGGCKTCLHRAL